MPFRKGHIHLVNCSITHLYHLPCYVAIIMSIKRPVANVVYNASNRELLPFLNFQDIVVLAWKVCQ